MQPITSKKDLYKNSIEFKVGQSYSLDNIKQQLIDLGYERYDLLEGRGGFSLRGGILDISLNNKQGIRIEFWGDEVDSIRKFDIMTQRSEENIESIKINPAHEELGENASNFIEFLSKEYLIALDEPSKISSRAQNIIKDNDIHKITRDDEWGTLMIEGNAVINTERRGGESEETVTTNKDSNETN